MNRFPDQLDQVPEDQHLNEAVGLGFAGVAAGCLLIVLAYAIQLLRAFKQDDALFAAGVLAVGAISGYLEFRRRRLPLTLVPRGEEIGAYRAGRFVQAFHRGQTTWYQLSVINTLREVMIFGFMAASLSLVMLTFLATLKFNVPMAWMVGGAIAANLLFYSSILTRVLSKQYYLPNTVATGTVAFRKSALTRFGW